jgi:hypothetical protein
MQHVANAWMKRKLTRREEVDGVCPCCGRRELILQCPKGHEPDVSDVFRQTALEKTLAIVGPRNSGKSLLIWGWSTMGGAALVAPAGEQARTAWRELNGMLEKRLRPKPTPAAKRCVWDVQRHDCGVGENLILSADVPGESWAMDLGDMEPDTRDLLRYSDSVILIVDGAAVAEALGLAFRDAWAEDAHEDFGAPTHYGEVLNNIARAAGRRRGGGRPKVALVVTKADLLWDPQAMGPGTVPDEFWPLSKQLHPQVNPAWRARAERVRDLLRLAGMGVIAGEQYAGCPLEHFAVSSVGFRPGQDDVERALGPEAPLRLKQPLQPYGVQDPLLWLLDWRAGGDDGEDR